MAVKKMPLITIPNIQLSLEQLLEAIRQLDARSKVKVARALLDTPMDDPLARLIRRLADKSPAEDIPMAAIQTEVNFVRSSHASTRN